MNFQDIPPVESPDAFLDQALKAAAKHATEFKKRLRKGTPDERLAKAEQERFKRLSENLFKALGRISTAFPSLEAMPEFYLRIVEATLDPERFRGALASVATAAKNIRKLGGDYARKLGSLSNRAAILQSKREGIGRLSSIVNRLEKDLTYLEKARKSMRDYPDLKPDAFTVCIAGFPNVGKSTLLNKITGSHAEINDYAFTTKTLNAGSIEYRHNTIQFLDTPGTLDRPEKMNIIERQAYLAMKYAAHVIIYVYDLTEPYPLVDQERLEKATGKYGKDVLIYLSKTDILDETTVNAFRKRKDVFVDIEDIKKRITELFEEDFL